MLSLDSGYQEEGKSKVPHNTATIRLERKDLTLDVITLTGPASPTPVCQSSG